MSYGIEIYNANGDEVFSAGVKYLIILGSVTIPQKTTSGATTTPYTFQIPGDVPPGEKSFLTVSALEPPVRFEVTGTTVSVFQSVTRNGSSYTWHKAVIYYGYYA